MKTVLKNVLAIIEEDNDLKSRSRKQVSRQDIDRILHATMMTPDTGYMLPWQFIVITNRKKMETLLQNQSFLKTSNGACILTCALPEETCNGNVAAAIEACRKAAGYIMFVAAEMGFGAESHAIYPDEKRMNFTRKELQIPPGVVPVTLVTIGWHLQANNRAVMDNAVATS